MQSSVVLDGVSITEVIRTGKVGEALYSGEIRFKVQLQKVDGKFIVFEYGYTFSNADNIDKAVDTACRVLESSLASAAKSAQNLKPS